MPRLGPGAPPTLRASGPRLCATCRLPRCSVRGTWVLMCSVPVPAGPRRPAAARGAAAAAAAAAAAGPRRQLHFGARLG